MATRSLKVRLTDSFRAVDALEADSLSHKSSWQRKFQGRVGKPGEFSSADIYEVAALLDAFFPK